MAHYRKIDTRIALDQKFNALPRDSKLIFFHLLSHLHLTSLGAMKATLPGLACELSWPLEGFELAFEVLCKQGMVQHDRNTHFLWVPQFLKYNAPESPNAVRAWESALHYLPECDLKERVIEHARAIVNTLPLNFQEALPDAFRLLKTDNAFIDVALQPSTIPHETNHHQSSISPDEALLEGCLTVGLNLSSTLAKALPIQGTNNKEQIANSKEQELELEKCLQKNDSEEKEAIEEIKNIVALAQQKNAKPSDVEVTEVFCYWQHMLNHPQAVLDAKRRKRIRYALSMGYSVAQLCDAILGCSYTPHNIGHNEQGQRYDGLHVILRDADQIDRFIRNAHSPPRLQNAADKLHNSNKAIGQQWFREKLAESGSYESG